LTGGEVLMEKAQHTREKSRSVLRTIRLPEKVDEILIEEAKGRGLSPNALISMVTTRFTEWDRFADRFHFISVTKELLLGLLNEVEIERVEYLAEKSGSHMPKEAMIFWFKDLSVENLIRFVDARCKYAGYGEFEHAEKQGRHTLTIRHELGKKRSAYLRAYFDVALRKTFHIRAEFETTENAVIIRFHTP
jgi:hypothetical protein